MLSDPAPDLLVNDIPASSPRSATGRSTAPQHTAKIIGCSLARLLINGRDTREAFCPWLRAFGSDSR